MSSKLACPCGLSDFAQAHLYTAPPVGEPRFAFSAGKSYRRELRCCRICGHFVSVHEMHDGSIYTGDYVSANYTDDAGLLRNFERINGLAPERSDNVARVGRIVDFARGFFPSERPRPHSVLDVGSGLCVFLHRMKQAGWEGTALDPDPRSARHAREVVGVDAVCGDFMATPDLGRYDAITFNKVLEHVPDPIGMLSKSAAHLKPGGFVYVELPDGERALGEGPEREEFFIDHFHIFSLASLALLAVRANFVACAIERLREPSSKLTLRAFLVPRS